MVAAVVACGSLVGVAQAETINGLMTNSANLVSFDSATPTVQSALIPITGVTTGVATAVGVPIVLAGTGTVTRVLIDFNPWWTGCVW